MRQLFEFSICLEVYDPKQLLAEALAHDDADPENLQDEDGTVNIRACLITLLDPGSLPGCSIIDSTAEGA